MFENIVSFFKRNGKSDKKNNNSKDTAKERLHLVLMQDRANVSADFLDLMKQEIIEVIKKYIEVDESAIDVRMTNKQNDDGTNGAPALYANIPILNIKDDIIREKTKEEKIGEKEEQKKELKINLENKDTENKIKEKEETEEKDEPLKENKTSQVVNNE